MIKYLVSSLLICVCIAHSSFITEKTHRITALFTHYLPARFQTNNVKCETINILQPKISENNFFSSIDQEHQEKPLDFDPYSPIFAQQLMVVFGTNSLAYRLENNEKKNKHIQTFGKHKKNTSKKKSQEKHWINQVMAEVSKMLPFQNDINLGSNSNTDVYVQLSAEKKWDLFADWSLDTTQTFRYGAQSKNYSETDFNFSQKTTNNNLAANRFSIIKTYEAEITWNDKLFMKQNFLNEHQLTYGIYTGGIYNEDKKDLQLQSWGPYFGWRIPLWKKWIYLDNDISYYKDITSADGYSFSANLQLEAFF